MLPKAVGTLTSDAQGRAQARRFMPTLGVTLGLSPGSYLGVNAAATGATSERSWGEREMGQNPTVVQGFTEARTPSVRRRPIVFCAVQV